MKANQLKRPADQTRLTIYSIEPLRHHPSLDAGWWRGGNFMEELLQEMKSERKDLVRISKQMGAHAMAVVFLQNMDPVEALKLKPKVDAYFEELKNE